MEKRFTTAVLSAFALHALAGVTAFTTSRVLEPTPALVALASAPSVEIALVVEESHARDGTSTAGESPPVAEALAHSHLARIDPTARFRARAPMSDGARGGEHPESSAGTETRGPHDEGQSAPSPAAPPKIALGLDGAIFESAVLDAHRRPSNPRRRVVHDDWSAVAVQVAADRAAPREGAALLTIEWDSEGRLQSIATSAHSSDPSRWGRLADSLRSGLSKRPKPSAEGRGLRLVYLVKSEIIEPLNQRSVLPRLKQGSFERVPSFKDLPPGVALNFGVKADTSTPGERVITVTLADSQTL